MRTLHFFKKLLPAVLLLGITEVAFGQDLNFDNLHANPGEGKQISWLINSGYGYGHRFHNANGAGQTWFYLSRRQNSTSWVPMMTFSSQGRIGIGYGATDPGSYLLRVNGPSDFKQRVDIVSLYVQGNSTPSNIESSIIFRTIGANNHRLRYLDRMFIFDNCADAGYGSFGNPQVLSTGHFAVQGTGTNSDNAKAFTLDNRYTSGFTYDSSFINNYGMGFHSFNDGNGANGYNTFLSGFYGLDFFTAGHSRMRINHNGNIGIGTIPDNNYMKLDVKTGYAGSAFRGLSGSNSNFVRFQLGRAATEFTLAVPGATGHFSPDAVAGDVVFRTEDSLSNIIFNNGGWHGATMYLKKRQVGIATKIVDHTLQVGDGISNASIALRSPDGNVSDNYIAFEDNAGTTGRWFKIVHNTGHNNLRFESAEVADIMVINRINGNIGIGTPLLSNPNGYKLAVNGTIGAKEVKVENTSTAWPDYVFKSSYKLMPLDELEIYIQENSHLPDVPSAEQVAENGINVGEMDAALLKKIEELTLYMLEQDKRIKALEAELAKQK